MRHCTALLLVAVLIVAGPACSQSDVPDNRPFVQFCVAAAGHSLKGCRCAHDRLESTLDQDMLYPALSELAVMIASDCSYRGSGDQAPADGIRQRCQKDPRAAFVRFKDALPNHDEIALTDDAKRAVYGRGLDCLPRAWRLNSFYAATTAKDWCPTWAEWAETSVKQRGSAPQAVGRALLALRRANFGVEPDDDAVATHCRLYEKGMGGAGFIDVLLDEKRPDSKP